MGNSTNSNFFWEKNWNNFDFDYEKHEIFDYWSYIKTKIPCLSNFNFRAEFGTLQARNSIKLTKLIADPGIAVVFALDYLIGVKQNLVCLKTPIVISQL